MITADIALEFTTLLISRDSFETIECAALRKTIEFTALRKICLNCGDHENNI